MLTEQVNRKAPLAKTITKTLASYEDCYLLTTVRLKWLESANAALQITKRLLQVVGGLSEKGRGSTDES